jgi:DNA-binding SARP family transcriptional activator
MLLICLLGSFRLLHAGRPVTLRGGSKGEALLRLLALNPGQGLLRDRLLDVLWPSTPPSLAGQSLNSLVYSLHKHLSNALQAASPVLSQDSYYRLNLEAGIGIDVVHFDQLMRMGELHARAGEQANAAAAYSQAVRLYQGDLCAGTDVQGIVERERLRARYSSLLVRLAEYHFGVQDYEECQEYCVLLLSHDPCREDAHRLMMRCYVRRGQRAQALRQYRLCENILRMEFETEPELATVALYDQVRRAPEAV